ncbi:unnamed protein product [Anisakis simplex]|uniref:Ovule protein n=1 Tax=Anisakis simplex TaxID=6269 RepID=A0A0M3J8I5_ANISI|nr:unnamed protein product [Anisakis simplex]
MEHRTLKYTTEDVSANSSSVTNSKSSNNLLVHFQNMENLQHLVQTIDVYDNVTNSNLPPPVRITPFSGMKPQVSNSLSVAFSFFVDQFLHVINKTTATNYSILTYCCSI